MKWFQKLKQGLSKTSEQLGQGIKQVFTQEKLSEQDLETLEELLVQADLGVSVSQKIIHKISSVRFDKEQGVQNALHRIAVEIEALLKPYAREIPFKRSEAPYTIVMVGVNGTGKTTTTAKLASAFKKKNLQPVMVACDTFRAAAVEQLKSWGEKVGTSVIARAHGADPAGLAYDAYKEAVAQQKDIVFFDTAGRLHTNTTLMEELSKIGRVLKKIQPDLPHETILVIDGTTGQNAYRQVEIFQKSIPLTGLMVTKLDGTAKGGIVIGLADRFKLPIYAVGVGEKEDDLQPFNAHDFAAAIMGVEA